MNGVAGRKRCGLTLVEVLAALAIISVLLAGVVTAKSRLVRQWAAADRTLAAVDAADALLTEWAAFGAPPLEPGGVLPGERPLWWRASTIASDEAAALDAVIVRLEVYEDDEDAATPLVTVDTLWPLPPPVDETTAEEADDAG